MSFNVEVAKRKQKIAKLIAYLESTDYQAIKFAEGEMAIEEFAPIKVQRRAARAEINRLEAEVAQL
jgi:hypothetical protein